MPKAGRAGSNKKSKSFSVANSNSVIPAKIVPMEIRRLMNSHKNSPKMIQTVIEFINDSNRQLDIESLPLLTKSGFTSCQIPKMATKLHI
jgi:hypothetical protein